MLTYTANASELTVVAYVRELANGASQNQTQQDLVDSDSQSETEQDPAQLTDTRPTEGQHSGGDRFEGRQASSSLAPGLAGDSQEASPAKKKEEKGRSCVSQQSATGLEKQASGNSKPSTSA